MHREAVDHVDRAACPPALIDAAEAAWDRAIAAGERNGYRNSQVTLLAPTGTIGFMMDCDTTGVEPDIALVKYKQLAGGGMMKIVNRTVGNALRRLGYAPDAVGRILKHIDDTDTIEGAADLKPEDLPVFDCAFKPKNGVRSIPHQAHLRMMAAVQPFLSGAISKTINMPTEATVDEIMQAYIDGWKMGLKAIAIYRDGSKRTQPLNTSKVEQKDGSEPAADSPASPAVAAAPKPFRRRMSATRNSITHKFEVAGHEGYLTVGLYEDGAPGELFITMAKEGSTVGGTMDSFGTAISLCLQYGVPLKELVRKFSHSRFEPSGFTKNPDIPMAKSLVDYIFRWMDLTFPDGRVASQHEAPPPKQSKKPHKARHAAAPAASGAAAATAPAAAEAAAVAAPASAAATGTEEGRFDEQFESFEEDAPACDVCGMITVRNGHCYRCYNCGNSMGCS
jgi:ribonucleoside-diphosphate reductase alpha chain